MSREQRHNFRKVCDAVAAVERGRVAKDMPGTRDMVDVRIRLTFRERLSGDVVAQTSSVVRPRRAPR
jgi:hypothetical protein